MRLEIAERLRCPRSHVATPLVLVASRVVERELVEGAAGCPVCFAEAHIRGGDVWFDDAGPADSSASGTIVSPEIDPRSARESLDRLMAQLLLGEPGGAVLLTGRFGLFAAPLARELDVAVVVINAVTAARLGVSVVALRAQSVPFSDHTFRAAALDGGLTPEFAADAARSVTVGGRILGALPLALPPLARELARDHVEWLAEREAGPGGVVRIRRA